MKLKNQRYFVLLSDKGVPVLSSLIARAKKPVTGKWIEVNLRPCCEVCTDVASDASLTQVIISSGDQVLAYFDIDSDTPAVAVEYLNTEFPAFGTFSYDGTSLCLKSTVAPSLSLEAVTS